MNDYNGLGILLQKKECNTHEKGIDAKLTSDIYKFQSASLYGGCKRFVLNNTFSIVFTFILTALWSEPIGSHCEVELVCKLFVIINSMVEGCLVQ